MARALSGRWKAACGGNVGLSEYNVYFLICKALGKAPDTMTDEECANGVIERKAFSVNKLPNQTFTFWEW